MKTLRTLAIILLASFASMKAAAQAISGLRINEIMVANVDRFIDPSWNYGGWIEVYNSSASEMNLNGMWISDTPTELKKIHITHNTPVPSRGFAVLWFGHHDVMTPSQINLKLDCDGGSLFLSNSQGTLLQVLTYPEAISRCSYGRVRDGSSEWGYTSQPTPGASNSGSTYTSTRLEAPQVNLPSQVFNRTLNVTVDIPEGATLRYTTDGSTPSLENGKTSTTGIFTVPLTTVYRFGLFKDDCLSSPIVTRTYIRKDKNFNIPIVSVVTDPDNLYSDMRGVFVKGTNGRRGKGTSEYCNWNMDWDRPVNFEYFQPTGECVLNMEAELSRCGGHSKGFTPMSFKLKASKTYEGQNFMPFQFFDDKPYLKHKMLQFRCGGNDFTYRLLDAALQSIVRTSGIDIDLQDYAPVCHYINGEFMGTINMREPNNRQNVYANHGLDDDEIDMFDIDCDSCYIQMCGNRDAWERLYKLATGSVSEESYEEICNLLDIDEICNYMAVQFFLGNTDWPQNNCKGWRPIAENGKFRFVLFDVDFAFSTDDPFPSFQGRQWYTFCQLFDVPGYSHFTREVELVPIFQGLLKFPQFRSHFIDTYCIVAGSVFEFNRSRAVVNRAQSIVSPMQIKECGYANRNNDPTPQATLIINSLNGRPDKLISAIRSHSSYKLSSVKPQKIALSSNIGSARLSINGQTITTGYFDGTLFPPVTLRAQAPQGFRFTGWRDGGTEGNIVSTSEELEMPASSSKLTLVACYERIADDTTPPVMVNEVSAGNSVFVNEYFKKNDWVELYNNTDEDIDLEGFYLSDNAKNPTKYCISGNGTAKTVIPAGGYKIIWCDNLPTDTQLHATFKLGNADNEYVILSSPDLQWADTLIYCAHEGRESVGRFPDGGRNLYRMYRPSIDKANTMNLYTTLWEPTEHPEGNPSAIEIAHSGGLGINCQDGRLHMKSEDEPNVVLSIYTLGGALAMQQSYCLTSGHESLDLWMLKPGTYVARLCDAGGNQCSVKFTKP